jgi:hypothetical protein
VTPWNRACGLSLILSSLRRKLVSLVTVFGSRVDLGRGVVFDLGANTPVDGDSTLRIETENLATLYDKSRVQGVSAGGLSVAEAAQRGALSSIITVGEDSKIRNYSGDVVLSTRSELSNISSATAETASFIGGANSIAISDFTSDNSITLNSADITGRDVKIMAGQGMSGGYDMMANVNDTRAMANLSVFTGINPVMQAPVESLSFVEKNDIILGGDSSVRAVGSIDLFGRARLECR